MSGLDGEAHIFKNGVFRNVREIDVVKFDLSLESGARGPRRGVFDFLIGFQDFLDALVSDQRFRIGIGHLGEFLHRLVHLPQIQDEDDQRTGRQRSAQHQAGAEPQNQASAHGDDDVHQGRELGLQATRAQPDFHALKTLFFQAPALIVLPRERLDHTDRRQHFFDDRNNLALFLANFSGSLLDTARVAVNHQEEDRGHGERDQRESPVEIEHDADHAHQRNKVDQGTQQRGIDEALDGIDVAGHAAEEIAAALLIVVSQGELLDAGVEGPA